MPDFDYTMEKLSDDLSICVTKDHRFGTDAFLLSDFAHVRRKDLACDLGTGCGIIPLLWFRNRSEAPKKAYGVDIQELAVKQLTFTVQNAGLGEQMIPVQADLSDLSALKEKLPFGSFDVVTCNPPYKKANHGILSESSSDIIARHETMCSIEDVCKAAANCSNLAEGCASVSAQNACLMSWKRCAKKRLNQSAYALCKNGEIPHRGSFWWKGAKAATAS